MEAACRAIQGVRQARRIALISDTNVMPLYGAPLAHRLEVADSDCFTVPAGEASKTRAEWGRITDAMLERGFGRDSLVVAVGGGVVGDLGGFVAATYMRGIPVIQVPTTLLAMIDASIGGKTGVDTPAGKNLVGAFHEPLLILPDPSTLKTLPKPEFRSGLAEAVKHALITSREDLEWLLAHAAAIANLDTTVLQTLIQRHGAIKRQVVGRDTHETGVRKTLNFGHTIGHAVEVLSCYSMLHGECVAIGMVVEARIAVALGLATPALVDRVRGALETFNLPTRVPDSMTADAVLGATRTDKKARAGAVAYALISDVGQVAGVDTDYGTAVTDATVRDAINMSR